MGILVLSALVRGSMGQWARRGPGPSEPETPEHIPAGELVSPAEVPDVDSSEIPPHQMFLGVDLCSGFILYVRVPASYQGKRILTLLTHSRRERGVLPD